MSILIDKNTRLIVQGITGRDGSFHASKMKAYGTRVVGGTSPGKAGENVDGIPVFNTVKDAVRETGANTSVIFVPAPFAKDAMMEAADAGIKLIVCITEGAPTLDVVTALSFHQRKGRQSDRSELSRLDFTRQKSGWYYADNDFQARRNGSHQSKRYAYLRSGLQSDD